MWGDVVYYGVWIGGIGCYLVNYCLFVGELQEFDYIVVEMFVVMVYVIVVEQGQWFGVVGYVFFQDLCEGVVNGFVFVLQVGLQIGVVGFQLMVSVQVVFFFCYGKGDNFGLWVCFFVNQWLQFGLLWQQFLD